jgi:hypothetical protein
MSKAARDLLDRVSSWRAADIELLEEAAREIEAWRGGYYRASADELRAIDEADASGIADSSEVEQAFRSFRR